MLDTEILCKDVASHNNMENIFLLLSANPIELWQEIPHDFIGYILVHNMYYE